MFFKRTKYPLPKFPENVIPTFKRLRLALSSEQKAELYKLLEDFVGHFRGKSNPGCSARQPIAELLYDRSRLLLDVHDETKHELQAYIGAAVRYVVLAEDPFSDDIFLTGLDDDVRVVNHVLEKLGLLEDIIDLQH